MAELSKGTEIRAEIDAETSKGLLLVNGGGVVALLALLNVLVQRPGTERLVAGALVAIVALTWAMVFAILHNRYRRACSLVHEQSGMRPTPWRWAGHQFKQPRVCVLSQACLRASVGLFLLAGNGVAIWGLFVLSAGDLVARPPATVVLSQPSAANLSATTQLPLATAPGRDGAVIGDNQKAGPAVDWRAIVRGLAAAAGAIAAILALRAAFVRVRDNVDEFISDLHRQSRWAALAALVASITAMLVLLQAVIEG